MDILLEYATSLNTKQLGRVFFYRKFTKMKRQSDVHDHQHAIAAAFLSEDIRNDLREIFHTQPHQRTLLLRPLGPQIHQENLTNVHPRL